MRIPFSLIPKHIQVDLVEKMDCSDFVSFQQSSRKALNVAKCVTTPFNVPPKINHVIWVYKENEEIQIGLGGWHECECKELTSLRLSEFSGFRFIDAEVQIFCDFDDDLYTRLSHFFHESGSTAHSLIFKEGEVTCSIDSFNSFLELTGAKGLSCEVQIGPGYLVNIPTKIESILVRSPIEDDDFATIRSASIEIYDASLGNLALNALLMEWIQGKREITYVHVEKERRWVGFLKTEILNGIDYSETANPNKVEVLRGSTRIIVAIDGGCFDCRINEEQ